jgi:hypothetical protein
MWTCERFKQCLNGRSMLKGCRPTAERKEGVVLLYRAACRPRNLFCHGVSNLFGWRGGGAREAVADCVLSATLSPSMLASLPTAAALACAMSRPACRLSLVRTIPSIFCAWPMSRRTSLPRQPPSLLWEPFAWDFLPTCKSMWGEGG